MDSRFHWYVDELICFKDRLWMRGWAFHQDHAIQQMRCLFGGRASRPLEGYGLRSPDVKARHGSPAARCRFAFELEGIEARWIQELQLEFTLDNGARIQIENLASKRMANDPYHALNRHFFERLHQMGAGKVLEIGARNRSGVTRRHLIPRGFQYIGMDIKRGGNVDVVGDAHDLAALFERDTFDAIFTMSVFEHLLMPWKVVVEMNRVMKTGGLVMVTTHHAFPLHEMPWDFWRFSDTAWHGLFNRYSGFEVIETALGEPASIVPHLTHGVVADTAAAPAFLASACLTRKISDTQLTWDVDVKEVIKTSYPV